MKHPGPCAMYFGKTLPVTVQVIFLNNGLLSLSLLPLILNLSHLLYLKWILQSVP